jgi:hypothetical protein
MTQSTDGQEEGPRVTNSGRVNWVTDSFTLTLERSLREGVAEDVGDCTRVSEIEIWRGREMSVGRVTECSWKSPKDSKSVRGRERDEAVEEREEEVKENEEERRNGLTLDTEFWAPVMSEVTKSLELLSKDINNACRESKSPRYSLSLPRSPIVKDEDSPDTHMSTTSSIPDSFRSSIDNPNSTEALRISITKEPIKIFEFSLRPK